MTERAKRDLRQRHLAARRARAPDERARASLELCGRAIALPEVEGAPAIAVYRALPGEPDPATIAEQLVRDGRNVALPRVVPGTRVLAFGRLDPGTGLVEGPHGLQEPPPGRDVPLAAIACFVVPGLAFDSDGRRLGRGGGHYDATLAQAPGAVRVGICFDEELVPALPSEAHDERVDVVVTERRVVRSARPR